MAARRDSWSRLENEGPKAYQAFLAYCDLPAEERSLTVLAERLGKSKSLCARWSAQFRWVERALDWDAHQHQLKRKRAAAERDKLYERQLQQNRIAGQALMVPLIALAKRSQRKSDPLAGVPEMELLKLASMAARALPRIHEEERRLTSVPEQVTDTQPLQIVGAEFTWVQSSCQCGHGWDNHDQLEGTDKDGSGRIPCKIPACNCRGFRESELTAD